MKIMIWDYTLTFDKDYGYAVTDSLLIRTLNSAPMLMTLIALVMIVFAGGIIANETSQGTIKFLLINPVRRGENSLEQVPMLPEPSGISDPSSVRTGNSAAGDQLWFFRLCRRVCACR